MLVYLTGKSNFLEAVSFAADVKDVGVQVINNSNSQSPASVSLVLEREKIEENDSEVENAVEEKVFRRLLHLNNKSTYYVDNKVS